MKAPVYQIYAKMQAKYSRINMNQYEKESLILSANLIQNKTFSQQTIAFTFGTEIKDEPKIYQ